MVALTLSVYSHRTIFQYVLDFFSQLLLSGSDGTVVLEKVSKETPMNIIDLIQEQSSSYTKNEQDIAYYILNHPLDAGRLTIEKLAEETNTSKAALIRFAKKLGFSGYSEFKYALNRFLVSNNAEVSTNYHEDSPLSITNIYINALQEFQNSITEEQVYSLAKKIKDSSKIRILGLSRSSFSAKQMEARLLRIGIDSKSLNDSLEIADTVNILQKNDLVIAFSVSDNTKFYENSMRDIHQQGAQLALITANPVLSFKDEVDYFFALPHVTHDNSFSFLDNQALFFVFIEVLLNALAKVM